jgi:hypothetical protein
MPDGRFAQPHSQESGMKNADSIARYRAEADTRAGPGFLPAFPARGISVEWYSNEVPPFAEVELDRLYGSMYASMGHFRIYGGRAPTNTYVVRKDARDDVVGIAAREGAHQRRTDQAAMAGDVNPFMRLQGHGFPF